MQMVLVNGEVGFLDWIIGQDGDLLVAYCTIPNNVTEGDSW